MSDEITLKDRIKLEKAGLSIRKNRKRNTSSTIRKNLSGPYKSESEKVKKSLAKDAAKMKTAPDAKRHRKLAEEYMSAKKKLSTEYLKDLKKSVKAYKSGGKRGKAYAKQHFTRKKLMGRKLKKIETDLSIRVRKAEKNAKNR